MERFFPYCAVLLLLLTIPFTTTAQCDTTFTVNVSMPFDSCGPATLSFTGPAGVDSWIWDYGDGKLPDSIQSPTHVYDAVASPMLYQGILVVTCNGGADTDTAHFQVTIRVTPTVTLSSDAPNNNACETDNVTFTALPANYPNYKFYHNGVLVQDFSINTYLSTFPIMQNEDSITVVATDGNGCVTAESNSVVMTFTPIPSASITLIENELCLGESTTLTAKGPGNFLWSPTGDTATTITVTPNETTQFLLTSTVNGCASIPASRTVWVDTLPVVPTAGLADPTATACIQTSIPLTSTSALNHEWIVPYGVAIDDAGSGDPQVVFKEHGTFSFEVIIWNEFCIDTAFAAIEVDRCLNDLREPVPEVFTPNGDGINDNWIIPDIDYFANSSLKIFNQWNTVVYESEAYANDWDGVDNNGNNLPSGSYVYVVDLGNGAVLKKGFVFIQR